MVGVRRQSPLVSLELLCLEELLSKVGRRLGSHRLSDLSPFSLQVFISRASASQGVKSVSPQLPRAVPVNSHCLAKWLEQTHFWMGPNLCLCQRTFPTVRRTRSAPPNKYTLLWTVPESPTLVLLRQGPRWSMQFSCRNERVARLHPRSFVNWQ